MNDNPRYTVMTGAHDKSTHDSRASFLALLTATCAATYLVCAHGGPDERAATDEPRPSVSTTNSERQGSRSPRGETAAIRTAHRNDNPESPQHAASINTINGIVQTFDGLPVSNAFVSAKEWALYDRPTADAAAQTSITTYIVQPGDDITNTTGAFSITCDSSQETATIVVWSENGHLQEFPIALKALAPSDSLVLTLDKQHGFVVVLIEESGEPITTLQNNEGSTQYGPQPHLLWGSIDTPEADNVRVKLGLLDGSVALATIPLGTMGQLLLNPQCGIRGINSFQVNAPGYLGSWVRLPDNLVPGEAIEVELSPLATDELGP